MAKFTILKAVEKWSWLPGEILEMEGDPSWMIENGYLEPYEGNEPNKHVIVVVDPVSVGLTVHKPE